MYVLESVSETDKYKVLATESAFLVGGVASYVARKRKSCPNRTRKQQESNIREGGFLKYAHLKTKGFVDARDGEDIEKREWYLDF
ncbi:hypothetical protein L5515_005024 [Caenorhabditis briggsae]|uniref:Uncharacterized protein n=1 Tax=Caenorhabditis briggsae TaxID=6238 RepID=A0AAE9ERK1_CAEBR|nr:hypothetical protein L5515_005024 [Caenorhabditis briggsae]